MQGKVPVGVTSVAGYTVTLAAAVGAVLAFLKGDRSDQTLGVLASAGVAVLAFLSTQLGRYAQAHAAVKAAPQAGRAKTLLDYGYASSGTTGTTAAATGTAPVWVTGQRGATPSWVQTPDLPDETWTPPLTDEQAQDDPDQGDPLDAPPDSFIADPKDKAGSKDHPS